MSAIANIILPVFALILLGWFVAKTPVWHKDATGHFNRFVFWVALPAMLFGKLAAGGAFAGVEPLIAAAYFGGSFLTMFAAVLFARTVLRLPGEEATLLGMGASFSNTVLLGLPLIVLALGDRALGPLTAIIALNAMLLLPATSLLIEVARGRRSGARLRHVVLAPIPALAKNPVLVAMAAGALWGFTGIGLAEPVVKVIGLLSGAAGPCALFALGAGLAAYRIAGSPAATAAMTVFKLVVHPAVVWVFCTQVFALDPLTVAVATMMAAIPVGATVFVLSQQYGLFVGPVTSSILISTGISAGTLAVLIALMV